MLSSILVKIIPCWASTRTNNCSRSQQTEMALKYELSMDILSSHLVRFQFSTQEERKISKPHFMVKYVVFSMGMVCQSWNALPPPKWHHYQSPGKDCIVLVWISGVRGMRHRNKATPPRMKLCDAAPRDQLSWCHGKQAVPWASRHLPKSTFNCYYGVARFLVSTGSGCTHQNIIRNLTLLSIINATKLA